jgi:hypothetical protein
MSDRSAIADAIARIQAWKAVGGSPDATRYADFADGWAAGRARERNTNARREHEQAK